MNKMFTDENEFRDLINDLPFDDTPDPAHRDHLEKQLLNALDQKKSEPNQFQPNIPRRILPSQLIKITVAACFILIVGGLLGFSLGRYHPVTLPETNHRVSLPIKISQLEGTVLVQHLGDNHWQELAQPSPIYLGDCLVTVDKAMLTLSLEDQNTLELYNNSSLSINEYNDIVEFSLTHGSVKATLPSPHRPFFINTPQGRLEALGTEFIVTIK